MDYLHLPENIFDKCNTIKSTYKLKFVRYNFYRNVLIK